MLGMDGIGLLRHLRRERPTISAIVITGRGDMPWPSKAMNLGAVDYRSRMTD
jgi:FixJ family two-component response regulator